MNTRNGKTATKPGTRRWWRAAAPGETARAAATSPSPTDWSRHGGWSRALARLLPYRGPAVLVMSLPRSGSSWTGEALGCAPDALYLREPVTQSDSRFHDLGTVFAPDRAEVSHRYRELADRAFAGCPDFAFDIVRFPEQWRLRERSKRRLVVKEVNPLACDWYLRRYGPRLVFLQRHPAGVTQSCHKNGWVDREPESWRQHGVWQAETLRDALATVEAWPSAIIVRYEDMCRAPVETFRSLYAFAGLTWNAQVEQFIEQRTRGRDDANFWGTSRPSRSMADAWRSEVPRELAEALREGYQSVGLTGYDRDEDWDQSQS